LGVVFLEFNVILVHLEEEFRLGDGQHSRSCDPWSYQAASPSAVDCTCEFGVEVFVVPEVAVVQEVAALELVLATRHRQLPVQLFTGLQNGILGGPWNDTEETPAHVLVHTIDCILTMFNGCLQRPLGVARPVRIPHEPLPPPGVVFPGVQPQELVLPRGAGCPLVGPGGIAPGAVPVGQDVQHLLQRSAGHQRVASPRGRDQVVAHHLLFLPVHCRFQKDESHLELSVLENVVRPHAVEDKLCLVGHPDDVKGGSYTPSFVDELDEGEARVLLQRVLPLLGAEQH
ncbi:unnamed protein product, partial [Ixodes pacificus]